MQLPAKVIKNVILQTCKNIYLFAVVKFDVPRSQQNDWLAISCDSGKQIK